MGSALTIIASILGLVTYLIKLKDTPEGKRKARAKDREERRKELVDVEGNRKTIDKRMSNLYDRLLRRKRRNASGK